MYIYDRTLYNQEQSMKGSRFRARNLALRFVRKQYSLSDTNIKTLHSVCFKIGVPFPRTVLLLHTVVNKQTTRESLFQPHGLSDVHVV